MENNRVTKEDLLRLFAGVLQDTIEQEKPEVKQTHSKLEDMKMALEMVPGIKHALEEAEANDQAEQNENPLNNSYNSIFR